MVDCASRRVGRPIIYADYFDGAKALSDDTFEALLKILFNVVDGKDNRDRGCHSRPSQNLSQRIVSARVISWVSAL